VTLTRCVNGADLAGDDNGSLLTPRHLGLGRSRHRGVSNLPAHSEIAPSPVSLAPIIITARALGLGEHPGRPAPFLRSIHLAIDYDLVKRR
jgi:hypothetical protein